MSYGGYEAYGNDDFGGGGFMEGSQGGSQSTPSKGRGGGGGGRASRDAQTLLPITAKQLASRNASDDDVIRIDNQEVTNVKMVGILSNVVPHSTNVNFQLDDGTGIIDGRMFLHADDADLAESEIAKLRDGIYVRVVGNLRTFQEKVSLSAFSVTPIEDFNEITHHFLDAIYVHCYNTKGPLQSSGGAAGANAFGTPVKGSSSGFDAPLAGQQTWNQGSSTYLGHSGSMGGGMDYGMMDSNFSPEQKAILDVLGTCTSDRGLKIDQIFLELRGQMSEDQLRGALNYLTSEGHVYSTIDENHFKRTA
uniref:Replication protein A C-terminal domain-containing protein n=1 Tax=Globisporangium ultimum (strain ATCC 200006 / CBS 805.95 / DAOM BR144) TaxID=431595 RepID=K3W659_GLOUD